MGNIDMFSFIVLDKGRSLLTSLQDHKHHSNATVHEHDDLLEYTNDEEVVQNICKARMKMFAESIFWDHICVLTTAMDVSRYFPLLLVLTEFHVTNEGFIGNDKRQKLCGEIMRCLVTFSIDVTTTTEMVIHLLCNISKCPFIPGIIFTLNDNCITVIVTILKS